MIGAAVLVIGLLLVLTGLSSARIPGGASFARPGIGRSGDGTDEAGGLFAFARRGRDPVRAFLLSPIHPATWHANGAILMGLFVGLAAFTVLGSIASVGVTTLLAGLGVLLVAVAIEGARVVARIERRRVFVGEPARPTAHPYKPLRGGFVNVLRAEFADESRWRDVLYVAINVPLVVIELVVVGVAWTLALALLTMPVWYDLVPGPAPGVLESLAGRDASVVVALTLAGLALLPVAASLSQLVIALHRAVVSGLLCTSESRELRREVETLRESRSAVLATEASELHRIERDLHDGAQQRLVALTIDLGLASERIDDDPEAARELIRDGQAQAREALAEIRQLVRGIAPSILLDRGLVPALESIAGRGPIPIAISSNLAPGERLPATAERTAYFVVTEALANVTKHSGATRCEVRLLGAAERLIVEVEDDGGGGAELAAGGGLAGLANRVAGVDGSFSVSSPDGGPTLVRAEIPLA